MPLFSVISICYNDLENLKRTYNSVSSQTSKDYEWLVIDGASNDGTPKWLSKLENEQLSWISEKDHGIFNAMNKGLDQSKGEYLIFMNSGDLFADSEVLKKVKQKIKENTRVDFLYGDSVDFTKDNHEFSKKSRHYSSMWKGMFTQHQAMFFAKDHLNGLQYRENLKITADYAFICEFIKTRCTSEGIVKLEFPVCRFLLGGTNEVQRIKALNEDFYTRKNILGLNNFVNSGLYVAHLMHHLLKKYIPFIPRLLRYN
ncbi:MAG TPA: glycosyltransferase family 2 protein [Bacteroidales bacterium]|nr:glycosyltransferase family 2 protein [Bacteroidales bacterium]